MLNTDSFKTQFSDQKRTDFIATYQFYQYSNLGVHKVDVTGAVTLVLL